MVHLIRSILNVNFETTPTLGERVVLPVHGMAGRSRKSSVGLLPRWHLRPVILDQLACSPAHQLNDRADMTTNEDLYSDPQKARSEGLKHITKRELVYSILRLHPEITNAQLAAAAGVTIGTAASYRCDFKRENAVAR